MTVYLPFANELGKTGEGAGVGVGVALGVIGGVALSLSDCPQPLQNALPLGFVRRQLGHADSSAAPQELQNFASSGFSWLHEAHCILLNEVQYTHGSHLFLQLRFLFGKQVDLRR